MITVYSVKFNSAQLAGAVNSSYERSVLLNKVLTSVYESLVISNYTARKTM